MTENPPSDCYQPHDDQGHREDVVEKVTAELTDVTASPAPAEPSRQLVESDPEEEEDPDAQTPRHEEPGHVWLCWTVGVWFSIRVGLQQDQRSLYPLEWEIIGKRISVSQRSTLNIEQ